MKYVWFCPCKRVHVIPEADTLWCVDDFEHRSIVQVCTHCGTIHRTTFKEDALDDDWLTGVHELLNEFSVFDNPNVKVYIDGGYSIPLLKEESKMVDVKRFIDEIHQCYGLSEAEADEILESVAFSDSTAFDWTGTKYKQWEWNEE